MSEDHNEAYYSVEDQRFLGEEGFGEEISRAAGEMELRKKKETDRSRSQRDRPAVGDDGRVSYEEGTGVGMYRENEPGRYLCWFASGNTRSARWRSFWGAIRRTSV